MTASLTRDIIWLFWSSTLVRFDSELKLSGAILLILLLLR